MLEAVSEEAYLTFQISFVIFSVTNEESSTGYTSRSENMISHGTDNVILTRGINNLKLDFRATQNDPISSFLTVLKKSLNKAYGLWLQKYFLILISFLRNQNGMICKAKQLERTQAGDVSICGDGKCVDACESPGYKCKCDNDTHTIVNDINGIYCHHKTRKYKSIFMRSSYYTLLFI